MASVYICLCKKTEANKQLYEKIDRALQRLKKNEASIQIIKQWNESIKEKSKQRNKQVIINWLRHLVDDEINDCAKESVFKKVYSILWDSSLTHAALLGLIKIITALLLNYYLK